MILIVSLTFFFYISFSIMLISVVGIYRSYWPSVISVLVMKCLLKPKVSSNYMWYPTGLPCHRLPVVHN